jgi:hypothetical protein
MLNHLSYTLSHRHKNYVILWFESTNNYVCISHLMFDALEHFMTAANLADFERLLQKHHELKHLEADTLQSYLEEFLELNHQQSATDTEAPMPALEAWRCTNSTGYMINGCAITLHFDHVAQRDLVHYELSQFEVNRGTKNPIKFWLYNTNGYLHLYKGQTLLTRVVAHDYHYIQGKFKMEVLCALHNNEEADWIATLHASTVALNGTATLLIGNSGSGKTTLTGLLINDGFDMVADDITPIKATDRMVYSYPGALSVKQGAVAVLSPFFKELTSLPPVIHHPQKGPIRYLATDFKGLQGYKAQQMVLVAYKPGAKTELRPLSVVNALEILIPQSWLSPKVAHAQSFMQWLDSLEFYTLTYSHTEEALQMLRELHS